MLFGKPKLFDNVLISFVVFLLEIEKQAATLVDHGQQTATGVSIFLVRFEMLGEFGDLFGQKSHLNFRRTGVPFADRKLFDDVLLGAGI